MVYERSAMMQQLAVGQPLAAKYGNFGLTTNEVADPEFSLAMVVGEEGVGKTSLVRDCEGALVNNFDLHSIPKPFPDAPEPLANFFPILKSDGCYYGPDAKGKETRIHKLTWEPFANQHKQLIIAAEKDLPRPKMIVFDTVKPIIRLRKDYVITNNLCGVHANFDALIDDGNAGQGWRFVYDALVDEWLELRDAGYGVWLFAHIVQVTRKVKGDWQATTLETRHNISDALYDKFSGLIEFKATIELVPEAYKDEETGRAGFRKRRYLVNMAEHLSVKSRSRVCLPDRIELPAENAWSVFKAAYTAAASAAN